MNRVSLVGLIVMGVVSFSAVFGFSFSGVTVLIGLVFFFVSRFFEKSAATDGLNVREVGTKLRDRTVWFWLLLPLVMNVVCFGLASWFLPEFIEHLSGRTAVTFDKLVLLVPQLALLAFGEEIAWRGFFQRQVSKVIPIIPTIVLTSVLFALAHYTAGDGLVVGYDLFFIFINSVLYGIIFHKTKNVWLSATSHFIANLFAIIGISFF